MSALYATAPAMPTDAADTRKDQRLADKQPANRRGIEAERLQQPDFLQPLLDAELEEQPGEQQRRHDEEGAEVREVLAEVGRAARRRETLRAHVVDGKSHRERVELAAQRVLVLRRAPSRAAFPAGGTRRSAVSAPWRELHNCCPRSIGMNAFGVAR